MPALYQIAEGWYQFIKASSKTRSLMQQRLQVCDSCPAKRQTTGAGAVLSGVLGNDPANTFSCGLCNCPLGALASVQRPACKVGKWDHIF